MPVRFEVTIRSDIRDAEGYLLQKRISRLHIPLRAVRVIDVYTIAPDSIDLNLDVLGKELLADPIIHIYSFSSPLAAQLDWDYSVEVGYRPGVVDTKGLVATGAIQDAFRANVAVFTSKQYLLSGALSEAEVFRIASEELANDLIETISLTKRSNWNGSFPAFVPKSEKLHTPRVATINLEVSDEELDRISSERLLALNLEEMKAIQVHFRQHKANRQVVGLAAAPTDIELEALAQNWSEHCRHKIFAGDIEYFDETIGGKIRIASLLNTYIKRATYEISKRKDWLISVFEDNAGIIKFDDDFNLVFKVETHNSPSALDPYGGALTGIVGVNRDPMGTGLGARLIFNTDVFCFGDPNYDKPLPNGLKHPRRVFEGVRRGVEHGGNKSGIPTVNGTIRFDNRYLGKPLVYCGTGGIMPARIQNGAVPTDKKIVPIGAMIVMIGGRIGADGIHGATFSSEALSDRSPTSAVQIGNPFTQKLVLDMLLEARDLGLFAAVHDNGAGGLSCSIAELARLSGGAQIELEKAPLKYNGLDPWEIFLSESQERMTLAVPQESLGAFLQLSEKRGVMSAVLGTFTSSGFLHVRYQGETVAYIDIDFLISGAPTRKMTAVWKRPRRSDPDFPCPSNLTSMLLRLLGRLNICSKEFVIRQYDHEVQASTVVKPLGGPRNEGPNDAAVVWPIEMMSKGSRLGVVVSNGINPSYGDIDTYNMSALAIDEAIRNAVCVGANPDRIAVLDNFCWSSPDDPFRIAQLVRACQALYDYAVTFGSPFISGKDSMYNDFEGFLKGKRVKISAPPTVLISALGIIEDIGKAVTADFKRSENLIYLLGNTRMELGGSEYFAMVGEQEINQPYVGHTVPEVDASVAYKTYVATYQAILNGLVEACHDCSEGGMAVALAEMALGGRIGAKISLRHVSGAQQSGRDDYLLFAESASRLLVEVKPRNRLAFEGLLKKVPYAVIGTTAAQKLEITGLDGNVIVSTTLDEMLRSWTRTLNW